MRDEFNNDNNNIYVDIVVVIVDKVSATYLDYPKVRRPYNNNNNIYVYIVVVIIVNVVNPEGGREREEGGGERTRGGGRGRGRELNSSILRRLSERRSCCLAG